MNRTMSYAKRNLLEMSRDVLSYIFCVAFPLVMLIIMTIVNQSIPKGQVTVFQIDNLAGGVIIFGQTFVMLFTGLQVATDRSTSFLVRLYATPMKSENFTLGYFLPMFVISAVQSLLTGIAAFVISLIVGTELNPVGLLLVVILSLPSACFFIALGMIFGTLLNEKSAPGMCSVIISLGSFVGGIWFDVERTGGVMYDICRCLPFYYCTKMVRSVIAMDFSWEGFLLPLIVVFGSALVLSFLAVTLFRRKMRADLS